MFSQILLHYCWVRSDIAAGYGVQRTTGISRDGFCGGRLARAWRPMEQNDQALAFATNNIDLSWHRCFWRLLALLLLALKPGNMAINKSYQKIAIALRYYEVFEAGCSRLC